MESILDDVKAFCHKLRPIEDICYLEHRFNDQLLPLSKEFNLLGLPVPKEFGGREADNLIYVKALERIGMEGSGIRSFFSAHSSLAQKTLIRFGNDHQKENYLKRSTKDIILAFALTEPEAGSNPLELKTRYKKDGDYYILNGAKYLITNANIADAIIVFAKNDVMSAFVIDTDKEGIEREELVSKMGTPTTNTGMFELSNYKVPKENLIGKEGEGWRIAKDALIEGRLSVAAGAVGSIKDCLIESINYSKEREQYGKPIARHQLIQDHIATIKLHLSSSYMMVKRAVMYKDRWDKNIDDKELRRKADLAVAEAKLFAVNAAYDAADRAVQIFGGRGWSFLYRVGRHLVDNRVCRIYEGTDEILKLKIASIVLGKEFRAYS
ncbi:MAG: acyl-CoA dehydrogenase [Candidatus Nitrosothermus koennekii]|nr:MAG: acyl-CoA dehydrogenase [Candidatus Nitrosothermus koennekii]